MSQKKEARRKPRLFLLLTLQGITTGNVREDDKNCRKTRFILHFFTFYNASLLLNSICISHLDGIKTMCPILCLMKIGMAPEVLHSAMASILGSRTALFSVGNCLS
jgi:hypothetical protein